MKKISALIIALLILSTGCEPGHDEPDNNTLEFHVSNSSLNTIDEMLLHFETPDGSDSIQINALKPDQRVVFDLPQAVRYYFGEENDLFIISKAYFSISGKAYFHSNCFCDPELSEDLISQGIILLIIRGIDAERGNVNYELFYLQS